MGRKKDPIWDHVEKLNDKEFKCKKCGEKFAGGASRIKAHLLGIEGKGIRTCHGIPKDVQLATSSTFGDSNKAPYSTVNSCNPQHSVISNMPNDSLRVTGHLQNLETLIVECCNEMEEIFSSDQKANECTDNDIHNQLSKELLSSGMGIRNYQEEQVAHHATMIQLPKLKSQSIYAQKVNDDKEVWYYWPLKWEFIN
ncbi:hypothetical protein L6164_002287 [Bauhinia variegata]|uniref:Uncharacterized protein n=2 Tax=Bauhinia variegata TaxID=167791 RepID=A0ACB9PXX1_BAUVA|nr:hypothetical protein L6164_002287 [Bauhinia variegata]